MYRAPGPSSRDYGPFALERVLKGAYDDTTCLTWSSCSQIIAVGSKDTTTRIYALQKFKNLKVYCLGGHSEPIVNVFFEKDSLACYTLSRNGHLLHWKPSLERDDLEEACTSRKKESETKEEKVENDEVVSDDQYSDDEVQEQMK